MTNASPRSPAVTTPSASIFADGVVVASGTAPGWSRRGRCRRCTSPARPSAASRPCRRARPSAGRSPRSTGVGDGRRVVRGVGLQPADERLVVLVALLDPLPAGVRHLAGRLLDQQALVRQGEVDAPAVDLAGQPVVVAVGVEAEQRQAEAVLAAGGPVAAAGLQPARMKTGITSSLKLIGRSSLRLRHLDRHLDRLARRTRRPARSAPSATGVTVFLSSLASAGLAKRDLGLGGHVAGDAVGVGGLDDERLPVAGGLQVDVRRVDGDLRPGGAALGLRRAGAAAEDAGTASAVRIVERMVVGLMRVGQSSVVASIRVALAWRRRPVVGREYTAVIAAVNASSPTEAIPVRRSPTLRSQLRTHRRHRAGQHGISSPGSVVDAPSDCGRRRRPWVMARSSSSRRRCRCSSARHFFGGIPPPLAAAFSRSSCSSRSCSSRRQPLRRRGWRRRRPPASASAAGVGLRRHRHVDPQLAAADVAATIGSPFCVTTTWQNRLPCLPAGLVLSVVILNASSFVSFVISRSGRRHLGRQADQLHLRLALERRGRPSPCTNSSVSLPCSTAAALHVRTPRTAAATSIVASWLDTHTGPLPASRRRGHRRLPLPRPRRSAAAFIGSTVSVAVRRDGRRRRRMPTPGGLHSG